MSGSHVVFVGNIPYGYTEEQLVDIFKEVGPVANFRLMFDRDTGKPRGYGFCDYYDAQTAASAVRNLNGYEVGGRQLRVDHAETSETKQQQQHQAHNAPPRQATQPNMVPPKMGGNVPQQQQPAPIPSAPPQGNAADAISMTLAQMTPQQLHDLMTQMKGLVTTDPNTARAILNSQPQLAYALFQAMIMMGVVDMTVTILQQQIQGQVPHKPMTPTQAYARPTPPQPPRQDPRLINRPPQQVTPPMQGAYPPQPMPMQGSPYQPQVQTSPPQAPFADMQKQALLQQVLQLTDEQINSLPPESKQNILQLKEQILGIRR
ncbi:hypothetical protein BZG36_02442 [Bifiguratus adelaidae]|uniref:RRM domain-containing protein n=1 Tax=Bifiguratus adelaidae TaxID=1938954 RepID=A0A261Y3J5_9FUNG|nr:hypothetical protein BZG36_02442 [Bifiguratus adelaidae]